MSAPTVLTASERRSRRFGLLFTVFTVISAGGVLLYMVYRERQVIFSYAWKVDPLALAGVVALHAVTMLFGSWNWGNLMNHFSCRLPYLRHFRYFSLSHAAKRLPGTLWYIAGRATLYRQEGIDIRLTSLASGVEYAITTLSGLLVGVPFVLSILDAYRISPWFLALALAATLALLHPRVLRVIFRLLKVDLQSFGPGDLLRWTSGYALQWLLSGLMLFLVINVLYPLGWDRLGYVIGSWIAVIMVTRLLVFAPSNLGITEIGFSLLLTQVMPAPIAVVVAVAFRLATTVLDIAYAGVWALISPPPPSPPADALEEQSLPGQSGDTAGH